MFEKSGEVNLNLGDRFYQSEGVVDSVSKPGIEWVVRINGVYWKARAAALGWNFSAGDLVKPVGREGNRLFIVQA